MPNDFTVMTVMAAFGITGSQAARAVAEARRRGSSRLATGSYADLRKRVDAIMAACRRNNYSLEFDIFPKT